MKVIKVRTAPSYLRCSVCKAPTRNACRMSVGGGRHIESIVCDTCLAKLPNRVEKETRS